MVGVDVDERWLVGAVLDGVLSDSSCSTSPSRLLRNI